MAEEKPVVLTCAQATGQLHLGNYLGAVRNWVRYLDDYECFFGIVDLHAITVPYVPAELRKASLECAAQYIACGLDPAKCHLFLQSHVTGHTELAWVLGCITPLGKLERMTQFKDKSRKQEDAASFIGSGLLYYPVLMAADILLYNADRVPVGEDQKQHVELTRDIASKFNETYSDTFKLPAVDIPKTGARVMNLQDPAKKMSKSDPTQTGTIFLKDSPELIRKKIGSAVTDSDPDRRIVSAKENSGIPNLLDILSACSDKSVEALEQGFAGASYADFKSAVADAVVTTLAPVQERYQALVEDKAALNAALKDGADAAQRRAYKTLGKVYRKCGFVERPR